ncbi:hypothetical protein H2248_011784 [Termitomyces sp. 'cryptogamus']|nr:hypothetical protein H2248_011784 [Termitomyces sp. 'cryptogamus']
MSSSPETQDSKDPSVIERNAFAVEEAQVNTLVFQEAEFPEGGWKAWSMVFGVWLHQFATLGFLPFS